MLRTDFNAKIAETKTFSSAFSARSALKISQRLEFALRAFRSAHFVTEEKREVLISQSKLDDLCGHKGSSGTSGPAFVRPPPRRARRSRNYRPDSIRNWYYAFRYAGGWHQQRRRFVAAAD